jgi:hypothetical protein
MIGINRLVRVAGAIVGCMAGLLAGSSPVAADSVPPAPVAWSTACQVQMTCTASGVATVGLSTVTISFQCTGFVPGIAPTVTEVRVDCTVQDLLGNIYALSTGDTITAPAVATQSVAAGLSVQSYIVCAKGMWTGLSGVHSAAITVCTPALL